MKKINLLPILWLLIYFLTLLWSAINPKDQFTWFLEVTPALFGLLVLAITKKRFEFTRLVYVLILIHCVILMIGGHYTYAEVPAFDYLVQIFGWQRNNYDKLGHFAQGFIPALIIREIFLRLKIVKGNFWLNFIVISICLAISALYELIEWLVAILTGESAEAFLGTQGYIWDTQSDMGFALFGAIVSLVLLSRVQDLEISKTLK